MKKYGWMQAAVLLSVLLMLALTCGSACAEGTDAANKGMEKLSPAVAADVGAIPIFKFPMDLRTIEDEAFEGTAMVAAELPAALESIGQRAFADIKSLQIIQIPLKTEKIAENAFAGSGNVTILGAPGSYARDFARENGFPFAPLSVMTAGAGSQAVINGVKADQRDDYREDLTGAVACAEMEKLRACRSIDEMKADLFDQLITHQVEGRAPPTAA